MKNGCQGEKKERKGADKKEGWRVGKGVIGRDRVSKRAKMLLKNFPTQYLSPDPTVFIFHISNSFVTLYA